MAFDGISVAALVFELNGRLAGGRILKISQPESDELIITVRSMNTGKKEQLKLLISADPSLPLSFLTENNMAAPQTAPGFCMLLRKHLNGACIISISQPGLERIIAIELEHYDEMGDLRRKTLTAEFMGRHSNIIFLSGTKIIDSIRRVNGIVSSVREVLPGREYFIPDTMNKLNPLDTCREEFICAVRSKAAPLSRAIYTSYTGISPIAAEEICYNARIDSCINPSDPGEDDFKRLYLALDDMMSAVKTGAFMPNIVYENNIPIDFAPIKFNIYSKLETRFFDSFSLLLETYYGEKNAHARISQKSAEMRKTVRTLLEKNYRKYELQLAQLRDTEKRDLYKIYGELLTAYAHSLTPGEKSATVDNYYDGGSITIPLDDTISPMENAKKYFEKYGKLKRTNIALTDIINETRAELDHLESIANSLMIAANTDDLSGIRAELIDSGYIKRKSSDRKAKYSNKPLHFISSDGFHMYVGKNNYQNEEVTFKYANGGDWWFHAKSLPGSHVIVRAEGKEIPDRTFEEAAALAAYYSKGREQEKVSVDYTERKTVKKTAGGKPGFVIYHSNYSMFIKPDITGIEEIKE